MLARLFEEQVQLHPERIAVKAKDCVLTYSELNVLANRLARQILAYESVALPDPRVTALLFEHGSDMITGTIGAVKAGKIYVPLDPTYPEDRLHYILRDSGAEWIVTNRRNRELALRLTQAVGNVKMLVLEEIGCGSHAAREIAGEDGENLNLSISGNRIAYLLYTSGSTGRPKGVIQTHENVCYYAECYRKTLGLGAEDRLTLFSVFSHDAAIVDIYSGLSAGASLYPMSVKEIDFSELAHWLVRERITVYHSVPTVFRYFIQELREGMDFPDLRFIVLGGEGVLKHDVTSFQKYFGKDTVLMNLYGQSESSYNSAELFHTTTPFTKVTLGMPNDQLEFLVIGEDGGEVEILGVGEIVVLCDHLALGYWNDPEKTEKAFGESEGLGRFYRTGDLGRLLMDGRVEFMGRKDFQVKIRGYRVELGEIESQLLKHPQVKETVVVALDDPTGNKFLAGYLVVRSEVNMDEVRSFLAGLVPDYMVPAYLTVLEQIPTTPNGKTDRKALEAMGVAMMQKTEYVAPAAGTEESLAGILAGILGMEKVGAADNFFELGVHSLRAISLVARIYQEFKVQIPLREIFRTPTIRELAQRIEAAETGEYIAIEIVEEREFYPLSSAQKRLYLLQQLDPAGMGYNMPKVIEIKGPIDHGRMEAAFRALTERHETLRTSFHFVDGEPVQKVHAEVEVTLDAIFGGDGELPDIVQRFVRPFELRAAPLFRVGLATVGVGRESRRNVLLFDMHHIVTDGTSMGIFFRDFVNLYAGRELPEIKLQYKDFAVWQNQLFTTDLFRRHEQYWLERLSGEIPVLNLPTDFPRPQVLDFTGDLFRFRADAELTAELNGLARQSGATLYMVLLAAYHILLGRYSGQDDIWIGAPVAGRNRADLQEMMGMFVNTLVMRNAPVGTKPFREFLDEVREHALQAFEHQDYQFEMLVDQLEVRRDLSRNPLFDVSFILQNTEAVDLSLSGLQFTGLDIANPKVKFDLTLIGYEGNGELYFKMEYRTGLFRRETIERMAEHFVNILRDAVRHPERPLAELEMILAEEREALLFAWNQTETADPGTTMVRLLDEQAAATPDQPALILGDQVLTYRQLNEAAQQTADRLHTIGVQRGQVVGLMAQRSFEMLIGLLGIWKAGGAYLPIDAAYPQDRIGYMIEDSGIEVLAAQKSPLVEETVGRIPAGVRVVYLERDVWEDESGAAGARGNAAAGHYPQVMPDDLAYVIYTSGSTGKPKGVMVRHRSIANTLQWWRREFKLSAADRVLQLFSFSFDGFLASCIATLIAGAAVVLLDDDQAKDLSAVKEVIRTQKVTQFLVVPSLFAALLEVLTPQDVVTLRTVAFGGEKVTPKLIESCKALKADLRICNEYGPTEASVLATHADHLQTGQEITIGLPIDNMKVYLLDPDRRLVPVGVPGELYIAGTGLAMGYWNRPELTAERFVMNPWIAGERMYRTGDLGRRMADGRIEFIGRVDHQVKIRGYRIETGEIEAGLMAYPTVKEAIVLDRMDPNGNACLIAYVVADGGPVPSKEGDLVQRLRDHLKSCLPEYMIPSYIVSLDRMPITPHGKLDRRALPEPDETAMVRGEYVAPASVMEAALAEIWAEVLGLEQVGVRDNFFEIGGHSLNAVKIIGLVHKRCNAAMNLRDLFQNPTVAGLANLIHNQAVSIVEEIPPLPKQPYYELSYAQKRLWYIHQMNSDSAAYNMAGKGVLNEHVEPAVIQSVFQRLIGHHESLRTCFKMLPEGLVQVIEDTVDFSVQVYDFSDLSPAEQIKRSEEINHELAFTAFNLEEAPLLKVALVRLREDCSELHCVMHHIISDGWSMDILNRDLQTVFEQEKAALLSVKADTVMGESGISGAVREVAAAGEAALEPLQIQYRDFAAWQNRLLRDPKQTRPLLEFWEEYLGGELPILHIPSDFARGSQTGRASAKYRCVVPNHVKDGLKELARQHNASLFMALLAGFNLFLARVSGQNDILLEIPAAGRDHHGLKPIIGYFINTLFLRSRLEVQERFTEHLDRIRRDTLRVLESQAYPMEWILEEIKVKYPSVPVFFNMLNVVSIAEKEETDLEPQHLQEVNETKFEMVYYVKEYANGIEITCHYLTGLFKPTTIEYFVNMYLRILADVAADPGKLLKEYGQGERKRRVIFEE